MYSANQYSKYTNDEDDDNNAAAAAAFSFNHLYYVGRYCSLQVRKGPQ